MFTDADHAKAVELYAKFRAQDWWPKSVMHATIRDGIELWTDGIDEITPNTALSAIAWAMVERLYHRGGVDCTPTDAEGKDGPVCYAYDGGTGIGTPHYGPTPFLALAAAIENTP